MIAAVLREFGRPLTIEEVPDPEPGPNDVVLRVAACGIDGTDLKLLDGFGYTPGLPFIMGHEPAGVIEVAGDAVREWKPGDRVVPYIFVIPPASPWYQSEREQLCPEMSGVIGVKSVPGGFAERLKVPACQLLRIPADVAWHDAAVLCDAGLTAWHAVRRSRIELGDSVLVIGVGGVGGFLVQFAGLAGARVIAVERSAVRVERAASLGAELAIDESREDVVSEVRRFTGDKGVDCAFDIVGNPRTMGIALDALCVGGRLVVVGYTPEEISLSAKRLAQNEFELIGSRGGSRRDFAAVIDMVARGCIQSIVTDTCPLANVNLALAELRNGNVLGRLVLNIADARSSVG